MEVIEKSEHCLSCLCWRNPPGSIAQCLQGTDQRVLVMEDILGTLLQLFAMCCLSHLVQYLPLSWMPSTWHLGYFHDPFVEVIVPLLASASHFCQTRSNAFLKSDVWENAVVYLLAYQLRV